MQSVEAVWQVLRHFRSGAQINNAPHGLSLQSASAGNWQTPMPLILVQVWPGWQSVLARQPSWHLPMEQVRGDLQSLLSVQVSPTSIFFELLQAAAKHRARTVNTRLRL